jgi:hypothetical protein
MLKIVENLDKGIIILTDIKSSPMKELKWKLKKKNRKKHGVFKHRYHGEWN